MTMLDADTRWTLRPEDPLAGPALSAVRVPFDVRTALAEAGLGADPRVDTQSVASDGIARSAWIAETRIEVPAVTGDGQRWYLHLGRAGDSSQVFLDGQRIGGTASLNREAWVDVSAYVGSNRLLGVRLQPVDPQFVTEQSVRRSERIPGHNWLSYTLYTRNNNPLA